LEVISPDKQAGGIVHQEFRRLDRIFNFYDEESEISRINKAFNMPVKVSAELIEVLELSKEINKTTDGYFDVSGGAIYDFWKSLIKNEKIYFFPSREKIAELKQCCGIDNLEINQEAKTILIKKEGVKIDLGAIAKGYMVDKAAEKLKQEGITSAIINAGGDIYCLGKNINKPWRVGVKNPYARGIIEKEDIVNGAIATSGGYEQFFEFSGRKFSHLIDIKSGFPVDNDILSVSVLAQNCALADSLATAFSVMNVEAIRNFFKNNDYNVKAFVIVQKDQKEEHVYFGQ
jgi:thiamine biosynthesis lipoprotein